MYPFFGSFLTTSSSQRIQEAAWRVKFNRLLDILVVDGVKFAQAASTLSPAYIVWRAIRSGGGLQRNRE